MSGNFSEDRGSSFSMFVANGMENRSGDYRRDSRSVTRSTCLAVGTFSRNAPSIQNFVIDVYRESIQSRVFSAVTALKDDILLLTVRGRVGCVVYYHFFLTQCGQSIVSSKM